MLKLQFQCQSLKNRKLKSMDLGSLLVEPGLTFSDVVRMLSECMGVSKISLLIHGDIDDLLSRQLSESKLPLGRTRKEVTALQLKSGEVDPLTKIKLQLFPVDEVTRIRLNKNHMAQENQQQPRSDEELVPIDDRQFWHTVAENTSTKTYHFMLDDQQFEVGAEVFRDAFQITPRLPNQNFVEPPPHDDLVSFIKQLGYPDSIDLISTMYIDKMYQPWRTFLTIINKCLTGKSTGLEQRRRSRIQILWGMVNNKNVDYAIWEDFQYQIDCKQSNAKKKELLPYPRFTKVIINHILSKHNTLSKIPESWTHTIKDDAVLGKLKFVNKGEDHPKYGMSIPDVMMSDTIRNSAHYAKYLARSTGTQSSVPTRRRRGKGTISRKNVEVKVHTKKAKDRVRRRNRSITIADNVVKDPDHAIELAVSMSLDEAETLEEERRLHKRHASLLDDHQKKKLKGVATEPDDVAQSLLNLRKVVTSDKSNWGSDEEEQLVTIDDEEVMKLLKDHLAIKRKNDSSKTILQRLVELEKKVDAMSKVDHTDAIEKSVKAHVDAMSKKELPKVVPDFGAKKTTPSNLPKSSTTTSDSDSVKEYDLKDELFQLMTKTKSFKTHPSHQELYDALMKSLLVHEDNFDKQYDITPTQRKRRTRADHEKDKKKRRQKDTDH
ncbi:hypothetical protein Tco_0231532 [Tanacetum coccineum]